MNANRKASNDFLSHDILPSHLRKSFSYVISTPYLQPKSFVSFSPQTPNPKVYQSLGLYSCWKSKTISAMRISCSSATWEYTALSGKMEWRNSLEASNVCSSASLHELLCRNVLLVSKLKVNSPGETKGRDSPPSYY